MALAPEKAEILPLSVTGGTWPLPLAQPLFPAKQLSSKISGFCFSFTVLYPCNGCIEATVQGETGGSIWGGSGWRCEGEVMSNLVFVAR